MKITSALIYTQVSLYYSMFWSDFIITATFPIYSKRFFVLTYLPKMADIVINL